MGWHMSLVGFETALELFKPKRFKAKSKYFYDNRLMYSSDCDCGSCRSVFHDAMFTTKDICYIEFPDEQKEASYFGCFSRKEMAVFNFLEWVKSKTNPFSHLAYFNEAVDDFIKRVRIVALNYNYLFWDSSLVYNYVDDICVSNKSEVERFLKDTCRFYDVVRGEKKANLKITKKALEGSPFIIKDNKIEYDESIKPEDVKELYEKHRIYWFYGDI